MTSLFLVYRMQRHLSEMQGMFYEGELDCLKVLP